MALEFAASKFGLRRPGTGSIAAQVLRCALAASAIVFCGTTAADSQIRKESDIQTRLGKEPLTFFVAQGSENACGAGCSRWIAVEGQFDKGAAGRFSAFVKRADAAQLPVFLHSTGGLTDEGIALGRFLRTSGVRAGVALSKTDCVGSKSIECKTAKAAGRPVTATFDSKNAVCSSACVFALLGATARSIPADVKLGVHSTAYFCFKEDGRVLQPVGKSKDAVECRSQIAARAQQLTRYIADMGIDGELISVMNSIPSSRIRYLTRDEIRRYGIETSDRSTATP